MGPFLYNFKDTLIEILAFDTIIYEKKFGKFRETLEKLCCENVEVLTRTGVPRYPRVCFARISISNQKLVSTAFTSIIRGF